MQMTGKKVEVYTIPFKSIIMYSSENGGTFDMQPGAERGTRVVLDIPVRSQK